MYSNNIVNFQESTTILNACTKRSGNLLNERRVINIAIIANHATAVRFSLIGYHLTDMDNYFQEDTWLLIRRAEKIGNSTLKVMLNYFLYRRPHV